MGFFRRIEDFFQRPADNTIHFSEAEKALRLQQLKEDKGPFSYPDEGFTYQAGDRSETVRWADIIRIVAYKVDRATYDEICMHVYWDGGDLLILEDDPGWYQFVSRLNSVLPVLADWETTVAFPAFQTNETIIYQR